MVRNIYKLYTEARQADSGLTQDAVIGRLRWERLQTVPGTEIRKRRKSAVIDARTENERLRMVLIEPDAAKNREDTKIPKPEALQYFQNTPDAQEVYEWSAKVGEDDPRYKLPRPFVPEYMLLEPWLKAYGDSCLDICFYHPVPADEKLYIRRVLNHVEAYTSKSHIYTLTIIPRRQE